MKKLIKLDPGHFVIGIDSKVKVGDHGIGFAVGLPLSKGGRGHFIFEHDGRPIAKLNAISDGTLTITHSTQPIELSESDPTRKEFIHIKRLSLPEVINLTGEVNVEKKSQEYFATKVRGEVKNFPQIRRIDIAGSSILSFEDGYNHCLEDSKDKMFTLRDIRIAYNRGKYDDRISQHNETKYTSNLDRNKIEWKVDFDESGKIILL